MSQPVILTDSDDASIRDAAALLESWDVVVRRDRELAASVEDVPDVRVIVTKTENPNALRDIVERVVWEVVPQLAEALIKEEIARLTR